MKTTFRNIKLRSKRKDCDVCSEKPFVTRLINYEHFCGMHANDKDFALSILHENHRMSVFEYQDLMKDHHVLIDVRSPVEFEMCNLDNSINIPLKHILDNSKLSDIQRKVEDEGVPVVVLCRRGNDSQIAVQHLRNKLNNCLVKDIIGGLYSWHYKIDPSFPIY